MYFSILILLGEVVAGEQGIFEDGLQLQMVQAVWRHGDRSPTETCSTDPIQESSWKFGGGGWGQLSPLGMEQHLSLGTKLRKRYIDRSFINKRYSSAEVYIRATDVNRTLISAMSNMIGMFGQGAAAAGVDYPKITNKEYTWPGAFVPIPVHTVDDDYDYLGNPDMICPRQSALWNLALQTPELVELSNRQDTKEIFKTLHDNCNRTYTFTDLWSVIDAFSIERFHNMTNPPFVNDDLFKRITKLNDKVQDYVNGIGINPYQGVDISREISKIRGGGLLNALNDNMKQKITCEGKNTRECKRINNLKYYVMSAHDTTVYAYLTVLGAAKTVVKPEGYPHYSAAVLTELWSSKNGSNYVKLVYHSGFGENFTDITNLSTACKGVEKYCPLEFFDNLAQTFSPGPGGPAANCANTVLITSTSHQPISPTSSTSSHLPPTTTKSGSHGVIGWILVFITTLFFTS